jgi:hypothetical protein
LRTVAAAAFLCAKVPVEQRRQANVEINFGDFNLNCTGCSCRAGLFQGEIGGDIA